MINRRHQLKVLFKLFVAAIAVAMIGTEAQAQTTLSQGDDTATINLQGHSASGSLNGVTSLLRHTPFVSPVDEIQDIGDEGLQWFLGVDTNLGSPISSLGVSGSDTFTTTASEINYSYGAAGATEIRGRYTLANPPGPRLDPQTTTDGNFHAALFMAVEIVNNDSIAHTYNLFSFHDLALTNVQNGTGFDANADERISITGTNPGFGVANNLITQTNFDASHPLFSQATIRVINPGDTNGDLKVTINPDIQTVLNNNASTVTGSLNITTTSGIPAIVAYEDYLAYGDVNLDGLVTINPDIQTTLNNNATQREAPDRIQAHEDIQTLLNGYIMSAVDLNNVSSVSPAGNQTGETLTSAFQWTFTLNPGESFNVDELLIVTPEPGSLGLLGIGTLLLMGRRRRR